jgi:hypothetical protein
VTKLLLDHDVAPVPETPLANGRRADICGLTAKGEIWIVEIKSCLADYACDAKWPDYLDYCDLFFFAVSEDFPQDLIPEHAGLIVADGFGGAILRRPEPSPLAPARRRMMILALARLAATRLSQTPL